MVPLHPLRVNAVGGLAAVLLSLEAEPSLCWHKGAGSRQAAPAGNCWFKTRVFVPLDGLVLTWMSSLVTAQGLFAVVERSVSS